MSDPITSHDRNRFQYTLVTALFTSHLAFFGSLAAWYGDDFWQWPWITLTLALPGVVAFLVCFRSAMFALRNKIVLVAVFYLVIAPILVALTLGSMALCIAYFTIQVVGEWDQRLLRTAVCALAMFSLAGLSTFNARHRASTASS